MTANSFVVNSNLLHRSFAARPSKVVRASGVSLFLENGQEILDASAGPAVSCLGHGRPDVSKAIYRQLEQLAYLYSGSRYTCDATEELAKMLLGHRPGGLSKAIFVNSGSEATDAAIKLATQYWHERGLPNKRYIIARKQSYHGNTLGALCISGHDSRRAMYRDFMSYNVRFVDPCLAYRLKTVGETDEEYVTRLATQLEKQILELGPENVSSFVAETVSGTTLGCAAAVPGYFQAVRALCDKYDILMILDEVSVDLQRYMRLLLTLSAYHRSCAAWERPAPYTHGSRKASRAQISRPSARRSVVGLSPCLGSFSERRSLMP